ncbi:glycoprotein A33 (transmembrane), paralog a [Neosynchiropus ocellatus]
MDGALTVVFLTCLMVSGVSALQVSMPKSLYEYARGDNITLPCSFKSKLPSPKLVVISWSLEGVQANAKETLILTYYYNDGKGTLDIKSLYERRVTLDIDMKTGKANLKLSSITLSDNKVFECRAQILGDDEGVPAATARLVVLVAPSTPKCEIQGEPHYGNNINLTCHSKEGSPPPTYKWESRDVRDLPRDPRIPGTRSTERNGVLSLFNITRDTSGYYTCTSTNKIRSAKCNITLAVVPRTMNVGATGGIIAGVVIFLLILVIVIYCCCCRKKKDKQPEYAMGVREEKNNHSEAAGNGDRRRSDEEARVRMTSDDHDRYADGSESGYREEESDRRRDYDDRQKDYDDRRSDYDDRRSGYNDRRSDYDDRRSDYNDRRSDYDDRRSDYDDRRRDHDDRRRDHDDRRSDYEDRRSDYTDRRDNYADRHERYDDERRYDDEDDRRTNSRYDEPYDDRDRPAVPANKPKRRDYDE